MSMRSWTENGYGFGLFTGNNSADVIEFLKNHEETFRNVCGEKTCDETYAALDQLEDEAEKEGIMDEDILSDGLTDLLSPSVASAVAQIICYETGVKGFEGFPSGEYCDETVMYVPAFPWQMSQKEKELGPDDIHNILAQYAEELNVPESEIGDQELEYFG